MTRSMSGVLRAIGRGAWRFGLLLVAVAGIGAIAWFARPDRAAPSATPPGELVAGTDVVNAATPVAPRPAAYDQLLARGAEVYAASCIACHGGDGAGNGPLARNLPVPARDFTNRGWMSSQSDGVLFTSILRGVPGTPMPSFAGRLSERDAWAAVAFVRGFSPQVRLDRTPRSEPVPAGATALGDRVFAASCAGCHGAGGHGDGPAAASFAAPPRNLANRDWLAGRTDQQLRGTLMAGLPGTPMPSFANDLTAPEIDAVIGHLRRLAGGSYRPNPMVGWGEETFLGYCASCHGVDGNGQGVAAGRLDPQPRNFRNPMWMAGQTDAALAAAIRAGRPGTSMPAFGALLSDDEIARLTEYLRSFAQPAAVPGADSSYRYLSDQLPGAQTPEPAPSSAR
ncbi:MAG: c-type cytochrome [Actinobacteria bacterium]|nr:c-type cytochrome [Actinomycetota bacterium]MBI3686560.1 c-type cytochrome [Actinomycetota bacterium]